MPSVLYWQSEPVVKVNATAFHLGLIVFLMYRARTTRGLTGHCVIPVSRNLHSIALGLLVLPRICENEEQLMSGDTCLGSLTNPEEFDSIWGQTELGLEKCEISAQLPQVATLVWRRNRWYRIQAPWHSDDHPRQSISSIQSMIPQWLAVATVWAKLLSRLIWMWVTSITSLKCIASSSEKYPSETNTQCVCSQLHNCNLDCRNLQTLRNHQYIVYTFVRPVDCRTTTQYPREVTS